MEYINGHVLPIALPDRVAWSYFRDVCGIILVFDVSNPDTFLHLDNWLKILIYETKCQNNHPILLLGNKNDKLNRIDKNTLDEFILRYNLTYREISCKYDSHLEEIFTLFVTQIIEGDNINDCYGIKTSNTPVMTLTTKVLHNHETIKPVKCCNIL